MELTRLNDIVERPSRLLWQSSLDYRSGTPDRLIFSNWQRDQRNPIGFAISEARMCGDKEVAGSFERGKCKDLQTKKILNDVKRLLTRRDTPAKTAYIQNDDEVGARW
jgi:hypothetical protein